MSVKLWAVLALSLALAVAVGGVLAQAPSPPAAQGGGAALAADVQVSKSRAVPLGVDYKPEVRKTIERVELVMSRDKQTWNVVDVVGPEKDSLTFRADADGLYYLSTVIVFKNGKREPRDVTVQPPEMKVLVDATPPVARLTKAERDGDELLVEWAIEDAYPDDAATTVHYRASAGAPDQWVPAATAGRRSLRFKPAMAGPWVVQVGVRDLAGNRGQAAIEIAAGVAASYTPPPPPTQQNPEPMLPASSTALPGSTTPLKVSLPADAAAPTPPPIAPAGGVTAAPVPPPNLPTSEPPPYTAPVPPPTLPVPGTLPAAVDASQAFVPATTPAPPADVKVLNSTRFEIPYKLDDVGPSSVSRMDLYVTRDDGRTWARWSQHPQTESPLRVALDVTFNQRNPAAEGDYGFRLVPISGAGLSEGAPAAGTPPDVRVKIDTTPPQIQGLPPEPHPTLRGALVLRWRVQDANKGTDGVLIEWGATPAGPWTSVAGPAADAGPSVTATLGVPGMPGATAPVGGTPAPAPGLPTPPGLPQAPPPVASAGVKVPDTGSYVWQLQQPFPAHRVYLRYTAWDAAGNKAAVQTLQPVSIDASRPRARLGPAIVAHAPPQ